jgi:hypothetical protein
LILPSDLLPPDGLRLLKMTSRRALLWITGLTLAVTAVAGTPPPRDGGAETWGTLPQDGGAEAWGTLRGRIVWKGDVVPQRKEREVRIHRDRDCCLKNGPLLSEDWLINPENRGVSSVFVWLEPGPAGANGLPVHPSLREVREKDVVLRQSGCRFVPHVLALREGQRLVVENEDEVTHNVKWLADPRVNPPGG